MPETTAIEKLRNRHVALLGFGVENRALARFLANRNIHFSVCDARAPDDREELTREFGESFRDWHLGTDYLDVLEEFQLVFRTPGISPLRPELRRARKNGVQFSSQTRLFSELCPAPLLGVTGTKGKGTTASMIAEILRDGPFRQVHLGGNIGQPPIAWIDALTAADLIVLELSSFQLIDWERSPQMALALNITRDHLDYHGDLDEYVQAKRNICRFQKATDWLIVDHDCPTSRRFATGNPARQLSFSAHAEVESGAWVAGDRLWIRSPDGSAVEICPLADLPMRGRHNGSNAAAAAAATLPFGIPAEQIAAGLRRFPGLPHRLEKVGEYRGVAYYDDSLATTPDAAIAAIRAFDEPLVLIAGGSSKGADFTELGETIARSSARVAILIGREAERIETAICRDGHFSGEIIRNCTSMRAAVAEARKRARPGDVVLLAPACASFDMFASYRDRGEQFQRWVEEREAITLHSSDPQPPPSP